MPWSAKAQALIEQQYGPVGAAARAGLEMTEAAMISAAARGIDLGALPAGLADKRVRADRFAAAVRQFCWPTQGLSGVKIAPFHLLASEGKVHSNQTHAWHIALLARLANHDALFRATRTRIVDFSDAASVSDAIAWWMDMTGVGGEGMVVKPTTFLARGNENQLLQPAVKCRGRDYLRIIHGPGYDLPQNLVRL